MIAPPTIETANLGMADSLILMVLGLVVFGPRRLPQIGRQIGKLMYEFRKASNDFKFQMEEELRNAEDADRHRREEAERQRSLTSTSSTQETAPQADAGAVGVSAEESSPTEAPAAATDSSSSYPDGSTYGEIVAQQQEQSYPRIQPPSTGETVAATRPGSTPREPSADAPATGAAAEALPGENETAVDQNGTVTEQATHHG